MEEAHGFGYSINQGAIKMYSDLQVICWWIRMKKEVGKFVSRCLNCQTSQSRASSPGGLT